MYNYGGRNKQHEREIEQSGIDRQTETESAGENNTVRDTKGESVSVSTIERK